MKQIEITTRVYNNLDEVDNILVSQGFTLIRKSRIEDLYMKKKDSLVNKDNIIDVLSSSVLIRYLNVNNEIDYKKITYKNKVYNDDIVISEEKISVNIDNIENAKKLFETLGYDVLVNVNYDAIVYSNNEIELCFQNVENLGLLLEYENEKDFANFTNEKILEVKNTMVNEIRKYGLNISDDFDIKKAYELIINNLM